MGTYGETGYSAHVDIRLRVFDMELKVAQVGPRFLILRDRVELPTGTQGELIIKIDGDEEIHDIFLHDGAKAGSPNRVPFKKLPAHRANTSI